jgi:hypothetical protein
LRCCGCCCCCGCCRCCSCWCVRRKKYAYT